MSGPTLGEQVIPAVAAVLTAAIDGGEPALSYAAIWQRLPAHIVSGKPTKRAVSGAIKAAGWVSWKRGDELLYRAPVLESDPLRQRGGMGDNSSAEQLRLLIERIERLEEEKRGIGDDIKDVYAEAKGTGFDPKTMRAVIRLRAMDKHQLDEQDALLDMYRTALGMA